MLAAIPQADFLAGMILLPRCRKPDYSIGLGIDGFCWKRKCTEVFFNMVAAETGSGFGTVSFRFSCFAV
jgi:hypothetical protein